MSAVLDDDDGNDDDDDDDDDEQHDGDDEQDDDEDEDDDDDHDDDLMKMLFCVDSGTKKINHQSANLRAAKPPRGWRLEKPTVSGFVLRAEQIRQRIKILRFGAARLLVDVVRGCVAPSRATRS